MTVQADEPGSGPRSTAPDQAASAHERESEQVDDSQDELDSLVR
jgi:hypothetical protein